MKNKFFVIVPVLNEVENLDKLYTSVFQLKEEFANFDLVFILVDDGSTDGTAKRATELSKGLTFVLLSHEKNLGPGKAFATAFAYLENKLSSEDWVMTIEGDNTSKLELVKQMFVRTKEGYEVILASPYMYGGGVTNTTTFRVILSQVANAIIKEFIGIHGILTMSSFFRLYSGNSIIALQKYYGPKIIERNGFESMIELLHKMIYLKLTISEVAMVLDSSLRKGKSKMKIMKTIFGYLTIFSEKKKWFEAILKIK